jgi:hypothetical protein
MALHPDVHPEATKVERARLDAAMAALNQAWDRIEAWHEQDVPPGRTARRARTAPTVPTVRTPPPGFRRIGVAAPYARGDQLELTGESADLLGLTALEGEPVPSAVERRHLEAEAAALTLVEVGMAVGVEHGGPGDVRRARFGAGAARRHAEHGPVRGLGSRRHRASR